MENEYINNDNNVREEMNALHGRYEELAKQVASLESTRLTIQQDIKTIENGLQNINTALSEITEKISAFNEGHSRIDMSRMINRERAANLMDGIEKSLRRLAVGTISSVMMVADTIGEKTSNIREGFEDIVAEAQYESKRKKVKFAEQQ